MANPSTTICAQTVVWNSLTWNADSGGPIGVEWDKSVSPVEDYTGADEYPRQVFTPRKRLEVRIIMRDPPDIALGTAVSNIVVTYQTLSATKTATFANMKFTGIRSVQNWGDPRSEALVFVHQSADGSTDPITLA